MQALKVDEAATWMTISLTCVVAFIKRCIISGGMDKVCIVFYGTVSTSPVLHKLTGSTDQVCVNVVWHSHARCAGRLCLPCCSKHAFTSTCTCSLPQLPVTAAERMHVAWPASAPLPQHKPHQTSVLPGAGQHQER